MTRSLTIAALFVFFSGPAFSQAAKPAPSKPQAGAQPASLAQAKPVAKSRRGQDARHCLDRSPNTAIIKCAEAYL
jgi:hypothetical protein